MQNIPVIDIDNLTYNDFIEYNKLYCPVSGSLVSPGRESKQITLRDINNTNNTNNQSSVDNSMDISSNVNTNTNIDASQETTNIRNTDQSSIQNINAETNTYNTDNEYTVCRINSDNAVRIYI